MLQVREARQRLELYRMTAIRSYTRRGDWDLYLNEKSYPHAPVYSSDDLEDVVLKASAIRREIGYV